MDSLYKLLNLLKQYLRITLTIGFTISKVTIFGNFIFIKSMGRYIHPFYWIDKYWFTNIFRRRYWQQRDYLRDSESWLVSSQSYCYKSGEKCDLDHLCFVLSSSLDSWMIWWSLLCLLYRILFAWDIMMEWQSCFILDLGVQSWIAILHFGKTSGKLILTAINNVAS